eukprot:3825015-Amphidinium_carterae.1
MHCRVALLPLASIVQSKQYSPNKKYYVAIAPLAQVLRGFNSGAGKDSPGERLLRKESWRQRTTQS